MGQRLQMIVAIHQPNFFPWLGFFHKILVADVFIFLDDVQFPKSGAGANSNRVKMLVSGEPIWVTASIDRHFKGSGKINEVGFNREVRWREKVSKTIETNYRRAPHFDEVFPVLEPLISNPEIMVAEYNSTAIVVLCKQLGICNKKMYWSSKLIHTGKSNHLLSSLTKQVGGTEYLTGKGALSYLDETVYESVGIRVTHQSFQNLEYFQHNSPDFVPGLSIIDAVMNIGFENVSELLKCS